MSELENTDTKVIKPIQELLTKEVDRKEFFSILGLGAITVIGLAPLVKFLTGKDATRTIFHSKKYTSGYSSGPYGV
jgi:hypothetical protein